MAATCSKIGTIMELEEMRKEYDLPETIMEDLYDIVENEEKCKEILEHGPYAITGDGGKAIGPQLAAGAMAGGSVPAPCTRTKSVAELYKEQGRKYKKEAWARRIAKLKRFLMGVNPTKKINP